MKTPPKPQIIDVPIADIIAYAKNSNTHGEAQLKKLTRGIKEYGFLVPCVVRTVSGGKYELAAGHGRVIAAERAGLDSVPCVIADHLTGHQFAAFVIADNKLASLAEWDIDMLKAEIVELKLVGYEAELLGFDEDEIIALLDGITDPEPPKPEPGPAAIAYNIIFDTDTQQETWFEFLNYLKEQTEGESIGARLREFIDRNDFKR